jgi:radical SAM protein with 4Fe4S-binding SPASM domain
MAYPRPGNQGISRYRIMLKQKKEKRSLPGFRKWGVERTNVMNEKKSGYIDPTFHLMRSNEERGEGEYMEYRKKWNENPINDVIEDFPIHLDLEANTNCNLKCFMCFQSFDPPKHDRMDIKIFKKAIDEGMKKGLCSIKTQYRGEPLLNPDMIEMVKYAKDQGVLEVMFNTNATMLTEERIRGLIDAGLDKIICSVDGCNEEIYEKVRIGGRYKTVLENIKNLQRIKKELGLNRPSLRVQMVDTPKNHNQIPEYIEFWGDIADQVAVEDMLDWSADEPDTTPVNDFACAQLWQRLIVTADGDVLPCCRAIKGGSKKLYVLGNIKNQSIESIWKGEKLEALRELHRKGESHKAGLCAVCGLRKSVVKKAKDGK